MTFRIDRSLLTTAEAAVLDEKCAVAVTRRARNKAAGLCINENAKGQHGLATHGVRCARCHLVKVLGKEKARETFEWHHFKPVLPAPEVAAAVAVPPRKRGPKPKPFVPRKPLPMKMATPRKAINTCALCTEITATKPTDLNDDGVMFEVCARCNGEHPRAGGYGFSDGAHRNRAGVDRAAGHHRTGRHAS